MTRVCVCVCVCVYHQANRTGMSYETLSETQVAEIQSQVQRYLEGSLEEINVRTSPLSLCSRSLV